MRRPAHAGEPVLLRRLLPGGALDRHLHGVRVRLAVPVGDGQGELDPLAIVQGRPRGHVLAPGTVKVASALLASARNSGFLPTRDQLVLGGVADRPQLGKV